ncbi:MAG: 2OG-Fe(II) oxygenase [Polyangiales bacterium]
MALYAGHFDFTRPLIQTIDALFSAEECARIIESVRGDEWLEATINSHRGRVVDRSIRDASTAVVRDDSLAETLFSRVRASVPPSMIVEDFETGARVTMEPEGVFVPLRVYRYTAGQRFGLHHDQSYLREDGARSLLTLLVYLNDDFTGGETDFPEQRRCVTPQTGSALWFQHMLLHAGRAVNDGVKYVLRSDVLYRTTAR